MYVLVTNAKRRAERQQDSTPRAEPSDSNPAAEAASQTVLGQPLFCRRGNRKKIAASASCQLLAGGIIVRLGGQPAAAKLLMCS